MDTEKNTGIEEEVIEEEQVEDEVQEEQVDDTEEQEESVETPAPKKRAESQIERLKRELKEAKEKNASKETVGLSLEDAFALTSSGIHKDDLKDVKEYAEFKNISLSEALEAPVVKLQLKENATKREQKASSVKSPNRTGGQTDELARAIAKYKKDGTLPDSIALTNKILDAIK